MANGPGQGTGPGGMTREQVAEVVRLANILYFRSQVFERTEWLGHKAAKCPMDMWVYQELIHTLDTDLLIETGTWTGGSALFFAHLFELRGRGRVITVDIQDAPDRPEHPRIEYLSGSSVDETVLARMGEASKAAESVMVILDADHKAGYKLREMRAYAGFVTPGNYLIAEDSCFDHWPAWPEFGPGPAKAVQQFVAEDGRFEIDRGQERHMITFSPMAFLKRKPD